MPWIDLRRLLSEPPRQWPAGFKKLKRTRTGECWRAWLDQL